MSKFNRSAPVTQARTFIFDVDSDNVSKADILTLITSIQRDLKEAKTISDGLDSEYMNQEIKKMETEIVTLVKLMDEKAKTEKPSNQPAFNC